MTEIEDNNTLTLVRSRRSTQQSSLLKASSHRYSMVPVSPDGGRAGIGADGRERGNSGSYGRARSFTSPDPSFSPNPSRTPSPGRTPSRSPSTSPNPSPTDISPTQI